MSKKIRKAVIPSAGFATRFLPASKAMPKQMLPLVDKPVIQFIVEQMVEAGIEDVIIVTNYHERAIEDHFDRPHGDLVENLKMGGEAKKHLLEEMERISDMANFIYVRQKGPYGNGTPLINVRQIVGDEPFIYAWGDEFFLSKPNAFQQLISAYEKFNSSCLSCVKARSDGDYNRFGNVGGIAIEDGAIEVRQTIEKPGKEKALSDLLTFSPYVFTPEIFNYLDEAVKLNTNGNELFLNDIVKLMIADGKRVMGIELKDVEYCDCGTKLDYLKTAVKIALKHEEIGKDFGEWLKTVK